MWGQHWKKKVEKIIFTIKCLCLTSAASQGLWQALKERAGNTHGTFYGRCSSEETDPTASLRWGNADLSHEGREINLIYLEFSKMLDIETAETEHELPGALFYAQKSDLRGKAVGSTLRGNMRLGSTQ